MFICALGPVLILSNGDFALKRTPGVRKHFAKEVWETIFTFTYPLLHIKKFTQLVKIEDGDALTYNGPPSHLYKSAEYVSRQPSFPKRLMSRSETRDFLRDNQVFRKSICYKHTRCLEAGHTYGNIRHLDVNLHEWEDEDEDESTEEDTKGPMESLVDVISMLRLESLTVRFGDASILLDVLSDLAPMPTLRKLRVYDVQYYYHDLPHSPCLASPLVGKTLSSFPNLELFGLYFPGHLFPKLGEDGVKEHNENWWTAEGDLLVREWACPTLRTVFMVHAFDESLGVYGLADIHMNLFGGRFSCWKNDGCWTHCEEDDGGRDFSFGGNPFLKDCYCVFAD